MKIRHIHTIHDTQLVNPMGLITVGQENNWRQTFFMTKLYGFLNKKLFDSPEIVISPSQWLLDYYRAGGFFKGSKLVHLPNPVLPDKIKTIKAGEDEKEEELKNNFLFIGQLEEHKGIVFLVETLKQSDLDFHLVIAGEGRADRKIREIVGEDERFELLGKVDHEKINQLFNRIKYLIVPSLCYENSPTVIYEALANNTPVVAADIGGVAELIKDGNNGFVFKVGDREDLLAKAKKALATELAGKLLGDYGMENYLKLFLDFKDTV